MRISDWSSDVCSSDLFSASALMHHYISLASRQVKAYWNDVRLDGADAPVSLKKYLYAVRPVMAVQWMADHAHKMPPVAFAEILLSVTLPADRKSTRLNSSH